MNLDQDLDLIERIKELIITAKDQYSDYCATQIGDPKASQTTLNTALSIAKRIKDLGIRTRALVAIAIAQMSTIDIKVAQITLSEAFTTAKQIRGGDGTKPDVLIKLVEAQALTGIITGDFKAALITAEQVEKSALAAYLYQNASSSINASMLEKAFEKKTQALIAIAKAQAKGGDTKAAQMTISEVLTSTNLAEYLYSIYSKAKALIDIAKAQANKDIKTAQTALSEAFTTIQQLADSDSKARVLIDIAKAQIAIRAIPSAQTTLSAASAVVQQAVYADVDYDNDIDDRSYVLRAIAEAQVEAGDSKAALITAQQLTDPDSNAYVLSAIAKAQAAAGDLETALSTSNQIRTSISFYKPDESQLKAIAKDPAAAREAKAAFSNPQQVTALKTLTRPNELLSKIEAAFSKAKAGDQADFKQLLIPCADYLDTAYEMCSYLAQIYPSQAAAIVRVMSEFTPNSISPVSSIGTKTYAKPKKLAVAGIEPLP